MNQTTYPFALRQDKNSFSAIDIKVLTDLWKRDGTAVVGAVSILRAWKARLRVMDGEKIILYKLANWLKIEKNE